MHKALAIAIMLSLLVVPVVAFAQFGGTTTGATTTGGTTTGTGPGGVTIPTGGPTSETDFWNLLCTGVLWFFAIVIVISFIMLLVAALTFMTGGGDEEKVGRARGLLTYAIIGIAVALLARAILFVVAGLLGVGGTTIFGC